MSITPVSPVIEMKIGGVWTDITPDVRLNSAHSGGGIRIKRGIPNEGTLAEPTQVDFVLNNTGGKYSPKNEMSENYGLLGRNTPVRFGMLRREDTFAHAETDSWGRMPSWVDTEEKTILGAKWRLTGGANRFDIASGAATIVSGTGTSAATFGVFGDCEIVTKIKVSARDSEFGIMMRMNDPAVDEQDFESGLGSWLPVGGTSTFALSTVQVHSGTTSGLLTVGGSPTTAAARGSAVAATPGRSYRLRYWVRCSASRTVTATIDWLDQVGGALSTSSSGTAVTANTWTLIEFDATCPDEAFLVRGYPAMGSSPANGTLLFIDDLELLENDNFTAFTAYITPGTTDVIRMGMLFPGGNQLNTTANAASNIVAGDWWWMKVQWTGIRRRIRWWKDGTTEPTTWAIRNYDVAADNGRWPMPKAGMVGLFAKDGTSTISFDSIQVTVWRAHAEIAELPPRWDLSREDQWVPISARGILRRLGQGRKALDSPLRLYFASYANVASAYVPLDSFENGGSTVPNLVTAGVAPEAGGLQLGTPDATGALALPGASGFAEFTTDTSFLKVLAKPTSVTDIWCYFHILRIPSVPASDILLYQVNATGSIRQWKIYLQSNGQIRLEGWNLFGTMTITQTTGFYPVSTEIATGQWVGMNLYVFSGGGIVTWALNYNRVGSVIFYTMNNTAAGASAGVCLGAEYYSSSVHTAAGNVSVANAMVYPGDLPFNSNAFYRASIAYLGEECIARWQRIGQNANIPVFTTGFTAESKPMGAQTMGKVLEVMADACDVDVSFQMEERDQLSLNMRTRESLYRQVPIDLDIDLGHLTEPLDPTDDDQGTRNYVTVRRVNGGSAVSIQTEGPLNINNPEDDPDGVGVYDESPEMRYFEDSQLQGAADWRRAKGTQDVIRYPSMKANLNSEPYDDDPALTAQLLSVDTGDILRVRNTEVGYEPTLQMIYGYDEFFDQYDYEMVFNTKPADIYAVGIVGKSTRVAASSQVLAADYTPGDPYMQVEDTTASGKLWVQVKDSPDSFPFDVFVSGARWRVHAVGDVRNATPSLRSGLGTWSQDVGRLFWGRNITVGRKPQWAFGAVLNNTGGTTSISARDTASVTAGQVYEASTYLRVTANSTNCGVNLFWYNASFGALGSVGGSAATLNIVDGWQHFRVQGTAPVGAAFAQVVPYAQLANGAKMYFDDSRVLHVGSSTGQPQYLSVQPTPINGVTKALTDGSPVTVAEPWRVAF